MSLGVCVCYKCDSQLALGYERFEPQDGTHLFNDVLKMDPHNGMTLNYKLKQSTAISLYVIYLLFYSLHTELNVSDLL